MENKIEDQVGAVLRDLQACSAAGAANSRQQMGSLLFWVLAGEGLFFCVTGAAVFFAGQREFGHGIFMAGFLGLLCAVATAVLALLLEGKNIARAVFKDSGVSMIHKVTEDTVRAASRLKAHSKEALKATRSGLVFHLEQLQGRAELIMGRRRERVALIGGIALVLLGMGAGTSELSGGVVAGLPSGILPPGLLTSDYFPAVMMMVGASLGAFGLTIRARDEKVLRHIVLIDLALLECESS